MAETMTAVLVDGFGGPEVLVPGERSRPEPAAGEVLIEVHAAGVNRPDILQRKGAYPPPPGAPDWPGLEVAGRVVRCGDGVARFSPGDAVMALLPGGGYAEYAVADEGSVLPVPAGISMAAAAAIPETFFTVWQNVFQRAGLKAGENFLVHGGTSGIGTTAIQLASAFGAKVFATAGSADKCAAAERLGAELCVDYRKGDFVEALRARTDGRGVDVILDMVGGDYVNRNLDVAAEDARIVQIAFLRGRTAEIDLNHVMRKRLTLTGSTLRNRSAAFKRGIAEALVENVWPLLEAGRVRPLIEATYRLEEAAEAHRHMDEDHVGKIVLTTQAGRAAA
ncbi:NAD(P)H-quinone oxidoreductase [Mangrovicella endophytica]|uniref:NAD(P)H-quinone oxidoreductase n=1 Tax=Mangrovicella endophytica TaxID=2066697 RepID=UPI000C9E072A|nr:NAD(P)H-quinone oxidoreductase [Mangrovicella endophytica]